MREPTGSLSAGEYMIGVRACGLCDTLVDALHRAWVLGDNVVVEQSVLT
jgi:hypothetical protein